METRARKRTRERRDATVANAGEAFRGLSDHLVVEHILRSDILGDPIDLARLRAVSHAMHDAVAATGRQIKKLSVGKAARRGCVSTLMHLERTGRMSRRKKEKLCATAARFG